MFVEGRVQWDSLERQLYHLEEYLTYHCDSQAVV